MNGILRSRAQSSIAACLVTRYFSLVVSPRLIRQFLLWLVIGIAIYGGIIVFSGWADIRAAFTTLGWLGWLCVLGLSVFNIAVRFVRWQFYLQKLGHKIPPRRSLAYFVAGFAFISTPAKAGEAVRSVYLKQEGVRYVDSLAALFVERLTDLIAVVLLALSAALAFESLRVPVIVAGVVTLALLPLVHSRILRNGLRALGERFGSERVRNGVEQLLKLLDASAALLRAGPLYTGMLLSLIAATAICASMALVLTLLGADVSPFIAIGIYATAILIGALSFLPGGIGSAEAVMGAGLLLVNVDTALIASVIILCRLAGMWFPISLGIATLIGLELTRTKGSVEEAGT